MRRGRNSDKVLMGVKFHETSAHIVIFHRYANKRELKNNPRIVGTTSFYDIYPVQQIFEIFPAILGMVIRDFINNNFDINRKGRRFQEHFLDHADIIVNMYLNAWVAHMDKKLKEPDSVLLDTQVFADEKSLSESLSISLEQAELLPTSLFASFESRKGYAERRSQQALEKFPNPSNFWGVLMRNMHKPYRNIQNALDNEDWEAVKLKMMCGLEDDEKKILTPPGRKKSDKLRFIGIALLAEEMKNQGCNDSYEMLFNNQASKVAQNILKSIPVKLNFNQSNNEQQEEETECEKNDTFYENRK